MIRPVRTAMFGAMLAFAGPPAWAVELVMVHEVGCRYCERWDAEIGPIYPKTAEGAYAPLRRVHMGDEAAEGITLARRVNFTPTFVLVDEGGNEVSRLEGYPGEDFFWGLLDQMLAADTDFVRPEDNGS